MYQRGQQWQQLFRILLRIPQIVHQHRCPRYVSFLDCRNRNLSNAGCDGQLRRCDRCVRAAIRLDVPCGIDISDLHGYRHSGKYGDVFVYGERCGALFAG